MRLDKWLWAARFYKTRTLAADAIDGGKVKLNGAAIKPAREVKVGDRVHARAGVQDFDVVVKAVSEQRRPAAEARLLYEETPESVDGRARAAELRRLAPSPSPDSKGRPTKRDRPQIARFQGE